MSDSYRYELKFVLRESEHAQAWSWLQTTLTTRERFQEREVNSLYFDDPTFTAAKENLSGVSDRSKLRLRWYNDGKPPFLEIKRRTGRLGSKSQFPLSSLASSDLDLPVNQLVEKIWNGLDQEQSAALKSQHLVPTLHVRYRRRYYEDGFGLRVTFDRDLQFRQPQAFTTLAKCIPSEPFYTLMEVKFPPKEKDRISRLLRPLPLTPQRHSKYLMGLAAHGQMSYI